MQFTGIVSRGKLSSLLEPIGGIEYVPSLCSLISYECSTIDASVKFRKVKKTIDYKDLILQSAGPAHFQD